jgi:hypothetical protein
MFESLASCFAFSLQRFAQHDKATIYSLSLEKIREQSDPALQAFEFTEIETDFEFFVNSNSFLRLRWRLNA